MLNAVKQLPILALLLAGSALCPAQETNIYRGAAWTTPLTQIDRLVFKPLAAAGIHPTPCSDAVFLRRAYLDITGTIPTAGEARKFLLDPDPGKRIALVDRLLATPEFADCCAMKWSDLLRVKAEFPVNLWPNAAQAYHHWIRASLRDNKPYDQFVREMLTANGSNFRVGPVNFYRAVQNKTPEGIASAVALTFMGTRTDLWPSNRLAGMAACFSQISYKPTREWKEEIVFWDPGKEIAQSTNAATAATNSVPPNPPPAARPAVAVLPDGKKIKLSGERDPREDFCNWLITAKNPWFAECVVNRIWSWLLGRGIIHEPDDIRPDNPPSNPALLAYLRKELVSHRFDLRYIYRLILTSRTYQMSSFPPDKAVPGSEALFACYPLRQLDAEVLIDALNRITGTTELYTSPIPEPFTFIPEDQSAVALPDGSITSSFLELFGRPARATGMENERASRVSSSQRMHLLNSSHIQHKIEGGPVIEALISGKHKPAQIIENLYLTILSRYPTEDETKRVDAYVKTGVAKGREVWIDLAWALINSDEFRFRH